MKWVFRFWPFSRGKTLLAEILCQHFGTSDPDLIVVLERSFPMCLRVDVQKALEQVLFTQTPKVEFHGLETGDGHYFELLRLSQILMSFGRKDGLRVAPPHYQTISLGDDQEELRVLHSGLWLFQKDGHALALLMVPSYFRCPVAGVSLQLGCRNTPEARAIAAKLLADIYGAFKSSGFYRGKVLSLEEGSGDFSGETQTAKVHSVPPVTRDAVILPEATLTTLERNVLTFCKQRDGLRRQGLHVKKGLLLYGPPGTGKTHTIRYLIGALQGHTVFLIRAEQMGLLKEYMILARLLQPSIVVIEDVDLIALQRSNDGPNLPLLNRLLDEMDGIEEEAEILFILTTNRPMVLEEALAGRPGRIDQAIEFPLPDLECRRRLVQLYAKGIKLAEGLCDEIARRAEGVSAAFIKELMRRAWQVHLESGQGEELTWPDVQSAWEEMTVRGGKLNLKLLGAERFGF